MIFSSFLLGTLSVISFYILYTKLPPRLQKLINDHSLASDMIACIGTYILFGGGPTVLLAAAISSIETSILLAIANDPELSVAVSAVMARAILLKKQLINMTKSVLVNVQESKSVSI